MSFSETKWPPSKGLPGGGAGTTTTPAPPVPMKLFGAWEVDKTPANCIPRLCTVTINKLILTKEALPDVSSLVIAVKMQSSKRTLRSNEISLTQSPTLLTSTSTTTITTTTSQYHHPTTQHYQSHHQQHMPSCPASAASLTSDVSSNTTMESSISMATGHVTTSPISTSSTMVTTATGSSTTTTTSPPLVSCNCIQVNLDLTFALQYPHFLKKSGNQLQILLQRRKRYKNRAILGFKTLAGGVINMAEVLQRSQAGERELDLRENISLKDKDKESSRKDHSIHASKSSEVIGKIIMSSLKSQPVDHDVAANGSSGAPGTGRNLKPLNESADMDSDEEVDEFSGSEGSDSDEGNAGNARRGVKGFNKWRRHIKSKSHHHHRHGRSSLPVESSAVGVHDRRNFKQKVIALLKKFKIPDSEASDSEEPEAALDNPDMLPEIGNIDDIFEFEDSDVDSTQDFDDFSISSTPRPGLKPFFSSKTTLVEENEPSCGKTGGRLGSGHSSEERDDRFPVYTTNRSGGMVMTSSPKPSLRPFFSSSKSTIASGQHDPEADTEPIDSSGTEHTPDTSDTSLKQTLESADTSSKVKSSSHHQESHHKEGKEGKEGKSKSSKHHQQTSKEQSHHQSSKSDRGGTGGGSAGSGGKNVKDTLKNLLRK